MLDFIIFNKQYQRIKFIIVTDSLFRKKNDFRLADYYKRTFIIILYDQLKYTLQCTLRRDISHFSYRHATAR